MTIGIDIEICGNVDCEHSRIGPMGICCGLEYPVTEYECKVKGHRCPVPKDCEYKNLHILSGVGLVAEDKCGKICLSKDMQEFVKKIEGTKYDFRNQF